MAALGQCLQVGRDVVEARLVVREVPLGRAPGRRRRPAAGFAGPARAGIREEIAIGPLDRRARHPEVALVHRERRAGHGFPLAGELGRRRRGQGDARVGTPHARRPRRPHIGRTLLRVDGHAQALTLRDDGGRESEGSAADDRHVAAAEQRGPGLRHRHVGRTPRQRPAAAAMSIVVHDDAVADVLDVHSRPGSTEGPQAHGGAEDAIGVGPNRDDGTHRVVEGQRAVGGRCAPPAVARGGEPGHAQSGPRAGLPEKNTTIHGANLSRSGSRRRRGSCLWLMLTIVSFARYTSPIPPAPTCSPNSISVDVSEHAPSSFELVRVVGAISEAESA